MFSHKSQSNCQVLIVGDAGAGKSALASVAMGKVGKVFPEDYIPNIGIELITASLKNEWYVRVAPGNLAWQSAYSDYHVGTVMIACDLTNRNSFEHLSAHYDHIKQVNPHVQIILVGTKADLTDKRVVEQNELEALAKEWGCPYIETSAKNKTNVDKLFELAAKEAKLDEPISSRRSNVSPGQWLIRLIKNHWRKMLIGALIVGVIVAIGVFTGGIAPAIAAAAVIGGMAVGAGLGALIGKLNEPKYPWLAAPKKKNSTKGLILNLVDVTEKVDVTEEFNNNPTPPMPASIVEIPSKGSFCLYSPRPKTTSRVSHQDRPLNNNNLKKPS